MKVEIFLVSWSKDFKWVEWNLKSIGKFCRGFTGVTILVPKSDFEIFRTLELPNMPLSIFTHNLPGHLGAQVQKCLADTYCPGVDFILHTDSDCVFTEPVCPENYFENGKPVMLIEEFSRLPGNPWKPTVDRALGVYNHFETMRRHPQVNPFDVYSAMRQHIESTHGIPFLDYVLSQKSDFPWGFSEHCTIGAFAIIGGWVNKYHWIIASESPRPKDKLAQFWSHSPPELAQDLPSGGRGCPMEEFKRIGI